MAQIGYCWFRRIVLFLLGLSVCLCLHGMGNRLAFPPAIAQSPSLPRSTDAGWQRYQAGQFLEAIALWEQTLPTLTQPQERAVLYTNLGQAYRQVGRLDRAIAQWEAAIKLYQANQTAENRKAIPPLLTEQAQAYSDLGQHPVAIERATTAIAQAQKNQDSVTAAAALGTLGNAQWALGNYEEALAAHQKSLTLACQSDRPDFIATALNNLGNVFASRAERFRYQANTASLEGDSSAEAQLIQFADQDLRIALAAYQQSAKQTAMGRNGSLQAQALLNLNRLLKDLPANSAIPSFPELTCPQLNFSALFTAAQTAASASQPPVRATQTPDPKAVTAPTIPNSTRRSLNTSQILAQLEAEPASRDKAYGYINLANTMLSEIAASQGSGTPLSGNNQNPPKVAQEQVQTLLDQALTVARKINDARAESFALGTLGRLYEQMGQLERSMELTRQAQRAAEGVNAADSLYRWQWQIGRLLKATGQPERAIAAYEQAIATLQTIRSDLILANQDLQFDFRDSVEPVYRELIGLLLETDSSPISSTPPPHYASTPPPPVPNLEKVLNILELLKLAELQNFFGDDCVQAAKEETAKEQLGLGRKGQSSTVKAMAQAIDPQAAVIYSIVLEDRTYMLLQLPNGSLKKYPVLLEQKGQPIPASRERLQAAIDQLRALLEKRSTEEYLAASQQIYDALLRPLAADLQAAKPSALVFINDGVLRKVPMAALHDGQQFLIQKYPLATTPSLSLTSHRPFNRSNLRALVMGLTLEQPPFAALPNVKTEVIEVQSIVGGTQLIDRDFTLKRMQERLKNNSYPIIHMATHGKFGPDAANTFLLSYSDRITIDQLDELLRTRSGDQTVELLTLSACQTAAGDDRAALGIAGVAVRVGVKSAIATLWFINDEATVPLIEEFYTQLLKPGTTKAEALQRAQVKLIGDLQYNHPAVWSPFILIGNWM